MAQRFSTSLTDLPRSASDKDEFGIDKYEKGLMKFIEYTNTPLTIALQGEWGSGKTSLMNSLKHQLCGEGGKFHGIWLNTWQFSLMRETEQTLISIIKGLTEEVLSVGRMDSSELKHATEKLAKVFGKVMTATTKFAVKATTGQDVGELLDSFKTENKETTIFQLRNELNQTIKIILKETSKEGFLFFIDDLDRIDPPVAVMILELLKNIFDLENCVFVLAIDYDVVIKGLEPKFGKFNEVNEREFRSFFDKIIQLPFAMPVTGYEINNFLKDSLLSIGYINQNQSNDNKLLEDFTYFANLSVGTNPRSIKRMLNYLSLISCINLASIDKEKNEDESELLQDDTELLVNFALVCIQIAYPTVYSLLNKKPDFANWDANVALQYNLKDIDEDSLKKINEMEEFDDEWEQVLFRYCEKEFYTKKNALKISQILNQLKSIVKDRKPNENLGDTIEAIIRLSSVTNMEAFDKPVINVHAPSFLRKIRHEVWQKLLEIMPEHSTEIEQRAAKIRSNAFIHFKKGENWPFVLLRVWSVSGKVRLIIEGETWMFPAKRPNFADCFKDAGVYDEYEYFIKGYESMMTKFSEFTHRSPGFVTKNYRWYVMRFQAFLALDDVESFDKDENIGKIARVVSELYHKIIELKEIALKVEHFYTNTTEVK